MSDGIDTLTAEDARNWFGQGSGGDAALPPNSECLGPEALVDATAEKVALGIEGVVDGGMDREEALG